MACRCRDDDESKQDNGGDPSHRYPQTARTKIPLFNPVLAKSFALPRHSLSQRPSRGLVESGQLDEIVLGNRLQVSPRLAPGSESADDHERAKSFFPQQMRHPGAGCFAHSSTVEVKVFVLREVLDFLLQVIGLDADGANDSLGSRVVITVAANVHNLHVAGIP